MAKKLNSDYNDSSFIIFIWFWLPLIRDSFRAAFKSHIFCQNFTRLRACFSDLDTHFIAVGTLLCSFCHFCQPAATPMSHWHFALHSSPSCLGLFELKHQLPYYRHRLDGFGTEFVCHHYRFLHCSDLTRCENRPSWRRMLHDRTRLFASAVRLRDDHGGACAFAMDPHDYSYWPPDSFSYAHNRAMCFLNKGNVRN